MAFQRAQKKNAYLRLALTGPSGSGKTLTSLLLAKAFVGLGLGKKVACIDSERGSASLYAHVLDFDVTELEEHRIQTYLEKITEAAAAGYDILVIDSYSHSWMGKGGALETVDQMGGWTKGGKSVSPLMQRLVDAILSYPGHVIATMRAKVEHAIEKDANGKVTVKKLGMSAQVREGTEYEFSFTLDLSHEGMVHVSKSRCQGRVFTVGDTFPRDEIVKRAEKIKAWLSDGAPMSPRDVFADRIRRAQSQADLNALLPELKDLPPEDAAALKPVYLARKQALTAAE